MEYPIYRVISFEIVGPYQLNISFDDGFVTTIDFSPVLFGEIYGPLRDLELFESVRLDIEVHTLVWPNGADFDPAMLHDWNSNIDAIKAAVAKWESVPT